MLAFPLLSVTRRLHRNLITAEELGGQTKSLDKGWTASINGASNHAPESCPGCPQILIPLPWTVGGCLLPREPTWLCSLFQNPWAPPLLCHSHLANRNPGGPDQRVVTTRMGRHLLSVGTDSPVKEILGPEYSWWRMDSEENQILTQKNR